MRRRSGCNIHLLGSFYENLLAFYTALVEFMSIFDALFQVIFGCVLQEVAVLILPTQPLCTVDYFAYR